jgi:hypothetical protein
MKAGTLPVDAFGVEGRHLARGRFRRVDQHVDEVRFALPLELELEDPPPR